MERPKSILRIHMDCNDQELANKINEAFVSVMQNCTPLPSDIFLLCEDGEPSLTVTVDSVVQLRKITAFKIGCQRNSQMS